MNLEHSQTALKSDAISSEEHTKGAYQAPAIETVMTTESLEREVLYAGTPPTSGTQKT